MEMILLTLHYLLPRTDVGLFAESQDDCVNSDSDSLISEDEPNGEATPCRVFENNTDSSFATLTKTYNMDSFGNWDHATQPDVLEVTEIVNVDDEQYHVTEAIFTEKMILNFKSFTTPSGDDDGTLTGGVMGYQVFDFRLNLELESEIEGIDDSALDDLKEMIYTNNVDDIFTVYLTTRDWRRCQYEESEGDSFLAVSNTEDGNRRRMGTEFFSFFDDRYEYRVADFDILGQYFEVYLFLDAGFTMEWEDPGDDDTDDDDDEIDGCSWYGGLAARLLSDSEYDAITQCCIAHKEAYVDCDGQKDEADRTFISCVEDVDSSVAQVFDGDVDDMGFLTYYSTKFAACDIEFTGSELFGEIGMYLNMNGAVVGDELSLYGTFGLEDQGIEAGNEITILKACYPLIFGIQLCFELKFFYTFSLGISGGYFENGGDFSDAGYGVLTVTPGFASGFIAEATVDVTLVRGGLRLTITVAEVGLPLHGIIYNLGTTSPIALGFQVDFEVEFGTFLLEIFFEYVSGFRCYFKGWRLKCELRWTEVTLFDTEFSLGLSIEVEKLVYAQWGNIATDFDYAMTITIQARLNLIGNTLEDVQNLMKSVIASNDNLEAALLLGLDGSEYRATKSTAMIDDTSNYDETGLNIVESSSGLVLFAPLDANSDYDVTQIDFYVILAVTVDTTNNVDFVNDVVEDSVQLNWMKEQVIEQFDENGVFAESNGYFFDIWQVTSTTSDRKQYADPTDPPSAAPTSAPTRAPSIAPTNAPSYCDQHIHKWLVNTHFVDDESLVKVYSPCDDVSREVDFSQYHSAFDHSNYFLKLSFGQIAELKPRNWYPYGYRSTNNKFSDLKYDVTRLTWSYNYDFIDTIIPILEIVGSGYIDSKDYNYVDSVPFEIKFTIFYEKYESEYENGIAIDLKIQDWPFKSSQDVLNVHIDFDMGAFPDVPNYEKANRPQLSQLRDANDYEYVLVDEHYYLLLGQTCTIDDTSQESVIIEYDLQQNDALSLDIKFPYFEQTMTYSSQDGI